MTLQDVSWVIAQKEMNPVDKFVLMAIADRCGGRISTNNDICSIAEYTCVPTSKVSAAVERLVDSGHLHNIDRGHLRITAPEDDPIPSLPKKAIINRVLRSEVFMRDGYQCLCCGARELNSLRADHVVPESKGGPTTIENLQTLCQPCNSRKGTKTIDYRQAAA